MHSQFSAAFLAALLLACTPSRSQRWAAPATQVRSNETTPQAGESQSPLTRGSQRLVRNLQLGIEVEAYVTPGLPEFEASGRKLAALLAAYERAANGKFAFRLIETKTDGDRERARAAGIQAQDFIAADGSSQEVFFGLAFHCGTTARTIPHLSPDLQGSFEFWISNKIREVRNLAEGITERIGVITNKQELRLTDQNLIPRQGGGTAPSLESIFMQAFPFYRFEPVDLQGGRTEIDPTLLGLIITQPGIDYSDPELFVIDRFLMRGEKSLAVFASAVTLSPQDPSMRATLSTHGLERLLTPFGIQINRDAVLDFGAQFRIEVPSQDGPSAWVTHPALVLAEAKEGQQVPGLETDFAAFRGLTELMMPFPSRLTLLPNKQPGDVKIRAVAHSSSQSFVETGPILDLRPRYQWSPRPPYARHVLAAVVEGRLKSAFAGAQSAELRPRSERAAKPSRVLVISSSQFLTNPLAHAGNAPESAGAGGSFDMELLMLAQPYTKHITNMILCFKSILDWMAYDEDLIEVDAMPVRRSP